MKQALFALLMAVFFATVALAATTMPRDKEGQKIPAPSWDATLSQAVTATTSQNITISGRVWYEFTPAADCQARIMNNTTKASWPKFTIYAKTGFRGSNDATTTKAGAAYLNISGCTGDYRAQ